MSRKCANSPKLFCYICGEFTQKPQTESITPTLKKGYELNFRCKIGDQGIAGHHIHVKIEVRDIYVVGSLALTDQCLSQSLWCGENRRIILPNATFV